MLKRYFVLCSVLLGLFLLKACIVEREVERETVLQPKPSQPQASQPQASEPQASEPQASEPQASEPQASEPQASEPQASEPQASQVQPILAKKFIGVELLANVLLQPSTQSIQYPFRGISGFDYDATNKHFYAISDDKGKYGPVRFYRLSLNNQYQVVDIDETVLVDKNGSLLGEKDFDAESIRYHPSEKIIWSSETGHVYVTDLITRVSIEFPLPDYIKPLISDELGARKNKFIEGITFTADFKHVMFALENPLKQDGKIPDILSGGLSRILVYEFDSQKLVAEYLYPIDAISEKSTAIPALQDNGVSEILALDEYTLLVLERSGRHIGYFDFAFNNRLFIVNLEKADNVAGNEVIPNISFKKTAEKKLLAATDNGLAGSQMNLESLTWGPNKKGKQTLYMTADDNFHAKHATKLIVISMQADKLLKVFD